MLSQFISYMFHDPDKGWKTGSFKIKSRNQNIKKDIRFPMLERKGENSKYFLG